MTMLRLHNVFAPFAALLLLTASGETKTGTAGPGVAKGEALPASVLRVSGFPDPTLLAPLDYWSFVPDVENCRPLVASRGKELLQNRATLHREVEELQARISVYDLGTMDGTQRQRAGDALLQLSLLVHIEALDKLAEQEKDHESRMARHERGILAEPPTRPGLDHERQIGLCRRIVDELPDYAHVEEVTRLLGYHLHAVGRYHESNNLFLLGLEKSSRWPDAVNLLAAYNYFELGRRTGRGSDAGCLYFRKAANLLDDLSGKTGVVAEDQRLFRLAWARFGRGEGALARYALRELWNHLRKIERLPEHQRLLKEQIVPGLVATYFCALPDWLTYGLHVPAQQALELGDKMDGGRPYEKDVYRLSLALLWEHMPGTEAQMTSRMVAYWYVASAYLDRHPAEPDCPLVHERMVTALRRLSESSVVEERARREYGTFSHEERGRLVQLYGKSGGWRRKNRRDSDAVRAAGKIVERSTLEQAQLLHVRAQEVKEEFGELAAKTYYRRAAQAYERFVRGFPDAPETLEVVRALGDVYLFGLANGSKAASRYARCRDFKGAEHPSAEDCAVAAMEARALAVNHAAQRREPAMPIPNNLFDFGETDILPEIPPVDSSRPLKKRRIKPIPMPEVVRLWMREARAYLAMVSGDEKAESWEVATEYLVARINFRYGYFGKARSLLESLLQRHSDNKLIQIYGLTDLMHMCRHENDMDCLEAVANRMTELQGYSLDGSEDILSSVKEARLSPADAVSEKAQETSPPAGDTHTVTTGGGAMPVGSDTYEPSGLPPYSTRIMVGPDDELPLKGLQVLARVDGFRARVLLDFKFDNPSDQQLEGTFQLCLPDGASPHFLAFGQHADEVRTQRDQLLLEDWQNVRKAALNTELIESFEPAVAGGPKPARMVSRHKAAKAYLGTVRRRVDPALMEWAGAGIFTARIYPLEAQTSYRIVVAYDLDLAGVGDDLEFRLDLPAKAPETTVDMVVTAVPGVPMTFAPEPGQQQSGDGTLSVHYPSPAPDSISLRLASPGNVMIVGTNGEQQDYFALRVHPRLPGEGGDDLWQPREANFEGGEDLLFGGRTSALDPETPLTIVGRGRPPRDAQIVLKVQGGNGSRDVRLSVMHRIESSLALRAYGEVAVHNLEAWGTPLEEAALPYARYFRVAGQSCSLLMLESAQDYRRFNIESKDDARFIQEQPVGLLLAKLMGPAVEVLADGREAFARWLDNMTRLGDIELLLPDDIVKALEKMPEEAFGLETTYPCDEIAELIEKFEQNPGNLADARAIAYQALTKNRGACVVDLLRQAAGRRPHEPDLYYLMALAVEQAGAADLALLYFEVVLAGSWDHPFDEFGRVVWLDYLMLLRKMAGGELASTVPGLARTRLDALKDDLDYRHAAIVVSAIWSTDASDVDLLVFEPSGELCLGNTPETGSGGRCVEDVDSGYGPEVYVAEKMTPGEYRIALRQPAGDGNRIGIRTAALVSVYHNWGTSDETVDRFAVQLNETGKQLVPVQ